MMSVKNIPDALEYYNKVKSMFGKDNELWLSSLKHCQDNKYLFAICSENTIKLHAINKLLGDEVNYGSDTITIQYNDDEPMFIHETVKRLFESAFKGNPILKSVVETDDENGNIRSYCVFSKELVQFYADSVDDLYGNFTDTPANIASEIFNCQEKFGPNIKFCTSNE